MNAFEQLRPYLDAALCGALPADSGPELAALRDADVSPGPELERGVDGAQLRILAKATRAMLVAVAARDSKAALERALTLREITLVTDPLGGRAFLLAARLARSQGDTEASRYFEAQYRVYAGAAAVAALETLSSALTSPYLTGDENPELGDEERPIGAASAPWSPRTAAPALYLPLSNAAQEPPTRTYIVLVRKLADPTTAAFSVFAATLADLTDGGAYGRKNRRGELYADLLLEFGTEALPLLESLDLGTLSMRLVFRASREYETFSVFDKSLFGLEASAEECRLYFKLKVPAAWTAAELPLHLIWSNLESCVLLSQAV